MNVKAAAMLMCKNEEHCIDEWIAWHKLIGFDNVIIYDDLSTDSTVIKAKAWFPYAIVYNNNERFRQMNVENIVLAMHKNDFDWILFADSDELLSIDSMNVKNLLESIDDKIDYLKIRWVMHGTNGVHEKDSRLMIEKFTKSKPDNGCPLYIECNYKSIVRTRRDLLFQQHCHSPDDGNFQSIDISDARICHYFTRSEQEFAEKLSKGNPEFEASLDQWRKSWKEWLEDGADETYSLAGRASEVKDLIRRNSAISHT